LFVFTFKSIFFSKPYLIKSELNDFEKMNVCRYITIGIRQYVLDVIGLMVMVNDKINLFNSDCFFLWSSLHDIERFVLFLFFFEANLKPEMMNLLHAIELEKCLTKTLYVLLIRCSIFVLPLWSGEWFIVCEIPVLYLKNIYD